MISRVASLILVAAVVGANGPSAHAVGAPGPDDAKAIFQRGLEAYDGHRYPEALDLFQRSYELSAKPEIIFDIAETHAAMGECQNAVDALDRLIAVPGVSDGLLSRARARRQELLPCGEQSRTESAPPDTASHDTPAASDLTRPPNLRRDDATGTQPSPPTLTLGMTSTQRSRHSPWQLTFVGAAGASVALLASGVVLGMEARASQTTVEASTTWNSQAMSADQRGRTQADTAIALLVASASTAALGALAYVLWHAGR